MGRVASSRTHDHPGGAEAFNHAVLDFLTAVDGGGWTHRNPASLAAPAILPAGTETR